MLQDMNRHPSPLTAHYRAQPHFLARDVNCGSGAENVKVNTNIMDSAVGAHLAGIARKILANTVKAAIPNFKTQPAKLATPCPLATDDEEDAAAREEGREEPREERQQEGQEGPG